MTRQGVIQNIVILVVATALAIYFKNGWSFLLLVLWLSPGEKD